MEHDIHTQNEAEENTYSFRDILMMVMANWVWFVVAIVLSLGIAAFKIYTTPKVYTRSSAILIKDSRRGNVTSALFADITAARVIPNVDNEIYLLGSQRLLAEVVRELKLDVWYTTKKGLRTEDLYGSSPIEVQFPDSDSKRTVGFKATKKNGGLILSEFYAVGRKDIDEALKIEYNFGDTVSTPIGRLAIVPTLYYDRYSDKQVINVRKTGVQATATAFMTKLKLSLSSELGTVIKITVSDVNIRRAEQLLNTLMRVYQDDVIADKRLVSDVSRRFIDDRLKVIETELMAEDERILSFKESNNLVDFQSQTALSMNEGSRLRTEMFGIENQIALVSYLRDYLEGETTVGIIPMNIGITDPNLNKLIADYNTEVLHRDELLRSSNDRNPTIMSMTSVLTAKFEGIMASIANLQQQLQINLDQVHTRERLSLGKISSVPGQENEMLAFTRQQTVKEQLYLYLLNKKEETDLSGVVIDSDARIVEYPYGSNRPESPKPVQIFLLAFLVGCLVPFVVLLVMNMLNTSIRSRRDVEGRVSIPFFGEVPYLSAKRTSDLVVKVQGRDPVSEAFRILRSNMGFMSMSGDMKVIMVTSSNVGSGKTFFSLNMASTLALTGKKVILIDGDMRKRTLTKNYGDKESATGLSMYLSDTSAKVGSLISENVDGSGIDMLFAGLQPPNPAELLLSKRLDELMAELRSRYDYIIIDSVPAFMVADAVITGRVTDHTVYVIREGLMDRRQLPDVEKLHTSGKLPNMMIVLNGIRESSRRYTYGYGYGYGYGKYGYGEEEDGPIRKRLKKRIKK